MSRPADILLEITSNRRRRLGVVEARRAMAPASTPRLEMNEHRFLRRLARPGPSIVAEVKLGSPRLGDLRGRIDPEAQAALYAEAGASALSVVVEPDYFFGDYDLLRRCSAASGLPTLAKDFIVDPRQLDMAAEAGAEAVLLIAALLDDDELFAYGAAARERRLVPLVETHSRSDIVRLGSEEWELVGVNNRDLRTFEVDVGRSERLRRLLPEGCLTVAESGIEQRRQIARLAAAGFDAFLVGEALLTAEDPATALRHLIASPIAEGA